MALIRDLNTPNLTEAQAELMADTHAEFVATISDIAITGMAEFHDAGLDDAHMVTVCLNALTMTLGKICRDHAEPGCERRLAEIAAAMIRDHAGLIPAVERVRMN